MAYRGPAAKKNEEAEGCRRLDAVCTRLLHDIWKGECVSVWGAMRGWRGGRSAACLCVYAGARGNDALSAAHHDKRHPVKAVSGGRQEQHRRSASPSAEQSNTPRFRLRLARCLRDAAHPRSLHHHHDPSLFTRIAPALLLLLLTRWPLVPRCPSVCAEPQRPSACVRRLAASLARCPFLLAWRFMWSWLWHPCIGVTSPSQPS